MKKKHDTICCAVLFTAAISGIAIASVLYMVLPTASLDRLCEGKYATVCELFFLLQGTLFSLCCAFGLGFFAFPLLPLAGLVALRTTGLTLSCYVVYTFYQAEHFLWQLLAAGLLGLLYLCFCRLAYLYGLRQTHGRRRSRYTLQFIGDFLFFCGISTVIKLACHLAAFT